MAKRPIRPDDLLRIVSVGDPQISPDGERILFARKTITEKNAYLTHLWTVDMEGALRAWTAGEKSCTQGRWCPDGSSVAFVSDRDGSAGLYLLPTDGGEARKLTDFPEGAIGEYRWSPDGSKIALTFRPAIPERTQEAKKEREEKGLSEAPLEIDDIWYRLDGDGYFANQRFELFVFDVASLAPGVTASLEDAIVRYTADPHGRYAFDWSPDSGELAVIHHASARPFIDPPNEQIWRLRLDGTAQMLPGLPVGRKSAPRWSPDGQWIAYAGDVDQEDPWGTRNTKVYLVPAQGGQARDLTGHQDYDLDVATLSDAKEAAFGTTLDWALDGSGLYTQIGWHGETQLGFVSADGGVSMLTEGRHAVSVGNVSSDGARIAGASGTATSLPEIFVFEKESTTGQWRSRELTNLNAAFLEEIELSEPEEVWIDTTDGLKVHGWVLKPPTRDGGIDEGKRCPAVLQIHGGPHTQYGWTFFHELQCQAAAGYVVVYTNPRGSKGYGEAWTAAIRGDWGHKDWEDVQSVTRWMKDQPFIDSARMAVMGGSYGGYMTNWAIGHTDEFACAITDRCVSNMVSMAGNSDFPFNKDGYFKGTAWGSLEQIRELWRQSPIAYFENVKTPTLVIHSAGDLRCNVEQGEQVFTALQMQGVPSRMVRYPASTSHGMSRSGPPDLRLHRLGEILRWLGRYMEQSSRSTPIEGAVG